MNWRITIAALLARGSLDRTRLCRRPALSRLALHPGQGAGDLAGRGVGRSAAR